MIDFEHARTARLTRKAVPLGIEVRSSGRRYALFGPDLGFYLQPVGVSRDLRWLTYDEAIEAVEGHLSGR